MGIQTIVSLIVFLHELVFGKQTKNTKIALSVKIKKYILLFMIIMSFVFNFYLYNKLAILSNQYIKMNGIRKSLEHTVELYEGCLVKNIVVRELLESCVALGLKKEVDND